MGPVLLERAQPADGVKAMVRNGIGVMPAFRPTEISDAELDRLAAWVENSKPNSKDFDC